MYNLHRERKAEKMNKQLASIVKYKFVAFCCKITEKREEIDSFICYPQ